MLCVKSKATEVMREKGPLMLLSVWLKFVSQPSCGADGIQVYPRPPGNNVLGERRNLVEWNTRLKKSPFTLLLHDTVFFPNTSYLGFDLLQLAEWGCLHLTAEGTDSQNG